MTEKTILIVDDQRFVREIVGKGLPAARGYRVLEAADGTEAIRLMGNAAPAPLGSAEAGVSPTAETPAATIDCIISDIYMLPMNGLEFLKAIRVGLTPVRRDMPVIMLTGHAEMRFVATAMALDVSGFIAKPVSANSLRDRIERAVTSHHTIKPATDYAALIVPDIEAQELWSGAAAAGLPDPPVHASDLAGGQHLPRAVPLSELEVGDRLAEDLSTEEGVPVVPSRARLTATLIFAIKDMAEIVTLKPQVMVLRG
jgi:two-component system, chemotaxis family, chemotaxis protein CheY